MGVTATTAAERHALSVQSHCKDFLFNCEMKLAGTEVDKVPGMRDLFFISNQLLKRYTDPNADLGEAMLPHGVALTPSQTSNFQNIAGIAPVSTGHGRA